MKHDQEGGQMCDTSFERWVARFYINKVEDSRKRGIPFNLSIISIRNILSAKRCYWTGIELTKPPYYASGGIPQDYRQRSSDITIDRIDASKPYVKGNVVACSRYANGLKSVFENGENDYEASHFFRMADKMRRAGLR